MVTEECRRMRERKEGVMEAGRVLRRNLDRKESSGDLVKAVGIVGILWTLTFLEHPLDRKADHHLLKGKNAGDENFT